MSRLVRSRVIFQADETGSSLLALCVGPVSLSGLNLGLCHLKFKYLLSDSSSVKKGIMMILMVLSEVNTFKTVPGSEQALSACSHFY